MTLINCEINLILAWSENLLITNGARREKTVGTSTNENSQYPEVNNPRNATFKITNIKMHVPVVTLSAENDKKLLEQLRIRFKRTIKWNKCKSEMTNQTQNNNLDYLIDPIFTKVNRLFVLSFENENERTLFSKYDVPNVQIKGFNVLIDRKNIFGTPIRNDEETYEQIIEMEEKMITRQAI